jgi:hypothetical protein
MKSLMRVLHAVLVLSLLSANPAAQAEPRQHSSSSKSYKGGFSSQRSSSPPPRAPRQDSAGRSNARGGFGSFNSAPSRNGQQSDSAMSRRLDREASQDRAVRTLDARRAQREQAGRDTRPVPGYENRQSSAQRSSERRPEYDDQRNMPAQRSGNGNGMGGVGGVVTGMVLGQMANGAAARNNGYPGQVAGNGGHGTSSASVNQAPSGTSFFGGVMRMFMWLVVLSAIGWLVYFLVQRKRRKVDQNKPNYTFEGQ